MDLVNTVFSGRQGTFLSHKQESKIKGQDYLEWQDISPNISKDDYL
jgi:hypothetical protein